MSVARSQPRRSVRASSRASRAGASSRPPPLRTCYRKACEAAGVRANSALLALLPDKSGVAFPSDTLDLSGNYVGDKGVVAVLAVVQRMTELRVLVLRENGLRNAAVQHLCVTLVTHPSVCSVDLSDNCISEGAAQYLEQLLRTNRNITEVRLENTRIATAYRVLVRELAAANREQSHNSSSAA